jgi:hypothetical protein|mmetsp:Transcript_72640/g.122257  ORF Transcript_72640/g.122257 Transcript_72640/m.122257 type:complete len:263 (+) Transcript_72640:146-934(+)
MRWLQPSVICAMKDSGWAFHSVSTQAVYHTRELSQCILYSHLFFFGVLGAFSFCSFTFPVGLCFPLACFAWFPPVCSRNSAHWPRIFQTVNETRVHFCIYFTFTCTVSSLRTVLYCKAAAAPLLRLPSYSAVASIGSICIYLGAFMHPCRREAVRSFGLAIHTQQAPSSCSHSTRPCCPLHMIIIGKAHYGPHAKCHESAAVPYCLHLLLYIFVRGQGCGDMAPPRTAATRDTLWGEFCDPDGSPAFQLWDIVFDFASPWQL